MDKSDNLLTYDAQLDFKKWALRKLGTKRDIFYFDCVTGVDAKTSKDIKWLTANGTMTWGEGLKILQSWHANKPIAKPHILSQAELDARAYREMYGI